MKTLYLVANWKSNKTIQEAKDWIHQLKISKKPDTLHIILCAPYTLLSVLKEEIQHMNMPILLGAQTVSSFPSGAYTGEVSAQMLQGLAEYVMIGHSERRRYFHEDDETLAKKVMEAKKYGIKCIYGVERMDQVVPVGVDMALYEPPSAIGSGIVGNTEEVNTFCQNMSASNNGIPFLYGGSVTETTVKDFISQPSIFGVAVGGASLQPMQFSQLIDAVASYE